MPAFYLYMSLCIFACMYLFVFVHACMPCLCIYIWEKVYIYTQIYNTNIYYIYIYYIYIIYYIYMSIWIQLIYIQFIYINRIYIYIYICIYIYIYIYIFVQKRKSVCPPGYNQSTHAFLLTHVNFLISIYSVRFTIRFIISVNISPRQYFLPSKISLQLCSSVFVLDFCTLHFKKF